MERDLTGAVSNSKDPTASADLVDAVAALRSGQLIVFPTETFYGIGADPTRSKAIAAILRVKGRQPDKPIALIATDSDSAFGIADAIPSDARLLAETFWPGPLTLVLPARHGLNEALIGPSGGVGVRVSPHSTARALAASVGGLLTATSANLSGEPASQTVMDARQSLGSQISVYVDGGTLSSTAPSTVIEFREDGSFQIVRPGIIHHDAIAAALRRQR